MFFRDTSCVTKGFGNWIRDKPYIKTGYDYESTITLSHGSEKIGLILWIRYSSSVSGCCRTLKLNRSKKVPYIICMY
jgi:hypothetical protein